MNLFNEPRSLSLALTAAFLASAVGGCASRPQEGKAPEVSEESRISRAEATEERIGTTQASEEVMRQLRELEVSQARQAGAGLAHRQLGSLIVDSASANFSAMPEHARIGGRVVHYRLDSDSDELLVDEFDEEWDASFEYDQAFREDRIRGRLGGNFRSDESLPYGQVVWEHRFSPRGRGRFELYLNEVSEDSPALRAIGAKHKVSVEYTMNVTATESATARLTGQRYHTRDYDRLAEGVRLEAEAASLLSRSAPVLLVRAYGSWQKNDLAERLPAGLVPSVLPPSANVSTVIARDYRTVGLGATVRTGLAESRPQAYADGWAGVFSPDRQFAYQVRLGASMPAVGADVLILEGFYTNVPGADPGESYRGLELRYQRRF